MSLQAASIAIRSVEGFVTDPKVKAILEEVAGAIDYAVKRLMPHQTAAQEAVACGKPVPATAPQPEAPCEDKVDA